MSELPSFIVEALGGIPSEPKLFERALTHGSHGRDTYERLEFLGDRVLGLIIVQTLLERFPTSREGELAPRLNALVSRETCALIGADLGLGRFLIVDRAERATGGPNKPTLLANAAEAVIGAIYLDGGMKAAEKFVLKRWSVVLKASEVRPRDPKSTLQEWAQGQGLSTPSYRHDAREGPDHAPIFTATVHVQGRDPALGVGPTKQEAEREAAKAMLALIGGHS